MFWANIVNSSLYTKLNCNQCESLRGIADILRFYATPNVRATETWEEFSCMIHSMGLLQFRYARIRGEALLMIVLEWARSTIPVSYQPYITIEITPFAMLIVMS